jgi:TonB family protein
MAVRSPQAERRRHVRAMLPGKTAAALTLNRKDAGSVLDVSESGLGFSSDEHFHSGSTASLLFELPGSRERVEARGVIAWTTASGRAGVRFLHLSKAAQTLLENWLARTAEEKALRIRVESRQAKDPEVKAAELAIKSRQLELEDALSLIVERARSLTRADGAAIALESPKGFLCRASNGNAPDLSVALSPSSGLSGECIRGNKIVRCDDTEEDPRADKAACRALDLRSIVIVPVVSDHEEVVGLLEVLSSAQRNFAGRDVLLLRQFASLVSRVVTTAHEAAPQSELAAPINGRNGPATLSSSGVMEAAPQREKILPKKQKPLVTARGAIICDVCGHENQASTKTCQKCDVPLPNALEEEKEAVKVQVPAPAALEELARQAQPRRFLGKTQIPRGTILFFAAVLLLLAAIAYGGWRYWQAKEKAVALGATPPVNSSLPESAFANNPADLFQPETRTDPPAKLVESSAPDMTVVLSQTPPASKPSATPKPAQAAASTHLRTQTQPSPQTTDSLNTPASTPEATPVTTAAAAPITAPIVSVPDPPIFSFSTPLPAQPALRVSSGVENAVLLKRVLPTYPISAKQRRVQGAVILEATIDRNGRISGVQVESGDGLLRDAAIQAVRQWIYKPARLGGQPIDVKSRIVVNFSMP